MRKGPAGGRAFGGICFSIFKYAYFGVIICKGFSAGRDFFAGLRECFPHSCDKLRRMNEAPDIVGELGMGERWYWYPAFPNARDVGHSQRYFSLHPVPGTLFLRLVMLFQQVGYAVGAGLRPARVRCKTQHEDGGSACRHSPPDGVGGCGEVRAAGPAYSYYGS